MTNSVTCSGKKDSFPDKLNQTYWMHQNGEQYAYIAVYVDDIAFVLKDPQPLIDTLRNKYNFKIKEAGSLEFHLGADFFRDDEGTLCMAPQKYIERLVSSYEKMLGEKPSAKMFASLESGDHPELDNSELLDANDMQ